MDTVGIKNYNITLQLAANSNTTSAVQNIEMVKVNSSNITPSESLSIKDNIDTNPIFIITPDGTTHRKSINELGEAEYVPSITLSSFKKTRVHA